MNEHLFKKGESGNPAGRPVGSKSFTTQVKDALAQISKGTGTSYQEELIKAILHKAIVEKDTAMMRLIWNYLDGMPQQHIDHSSEDGSMSPLKDLTDEELEERIKDAKRRKAEEGEGEKSA